MSPRTLDENRAIAAQGLAKFSSEPVSHFVNGQWVGSRSNAVFDNFSPSDGRLLGKVAAGDAHEVDAAAKVKLSVLLSFLIFLRVDRYKRM